MFDDFPPAHNSFSIDARHFKTIFDVSWKVGTVLFFIFRLYFNEQALIESSKRLEIRMGQFETKLNEQNRQMIDTNAELRFIKEQISNEKSYAEQTRNKR